MLARQILIAGCGDVGATLGRLLSADGHTVWGLRRRPELLPACIRPVAADLTASDLLDRLPQQITDVIYTAAATERSDQAYTDAYVKGLDNLLTTLATQKQPVRRVLFTSSTAVYGQSDGQWVDEDADTEPAGFAGRCLLEAEQRCRNGPYPATIVRVAGIYGPNRTGLLTRLHRGEARCPATVRYGNRIHRDDCAGVLHHLIGLKHPAQTYVAVDHDPADMRKVLHWLADELGVPRPPEHSVGHGPPQPIDQNKRCCNGRIIRSGYVFRFPSYRNGYGPIIRDFRNALGLTTKS